VNALTLELLAWVARRPRAYAEAIDVWRSNCSHHPVWDDALSEGLVEVSRRDGTVGLTVMLTPRGRLLRDGTDRAP
jgi:hypothetical protein